MPTPPLFEQPVAWGDMDALGHVNNAVYFRYIESARVAFLLWAGIDRLRLGQGPGVILQSAQCRFRRPVVYPDTLLISSRISSIEADRFTLEHEMRSKALGEVAALGFGVIVAYDYINNVKTTIPDDWRPSLQAAMTPA